MTNRRLRTLVLVAGFGLAAALSGCVVYEPGPGYYAAPPGVYFGLRGGEGWHHHGHWGRGRDWD